MSKKKVKQLPLPLFDELCKLDKDIFNKQLTWQTPDYITDNMVHTFRYYQNEALRFFHYSQTNENFKHRNINHVLFNMATGSGKTDLMAGLILYMYQELGYRNFLFMVNARGVLDKTIDNLTNKSSDKYLYDSDIEIEGERIEIRKVDEFPLFQSENTIYLRLETVQTIASDIYTPKENTMGEEEYSRHKMVVLGDEAHHYSASTKDEKNTEQSWEKAISTILNARDDNRLLEFTATIDLENDKIYEKYKDKIIYRYTLAQFISKGYSKNVNRIQSSNSDIENMLNVVLLSEYRRRYALEKHDTYIKPVVMFKSQRVAQSNESEERFNDLIESLTVDYLKNFLERQVQLSDEEDSQTLDLAYNYYRENEDNLANIIRDIKREFSSNRIINANDSDRSNMMERGQYEKLNSLESPSNLYRVIFAVARLTEGWDVLNLYDIVRLSDDPATKGTGRTTMQEAQLIGRGARYNPFLLNGKRSFQRRFEDGSVGSLLLETIHYHTINEPQYLKNLVKSLDEMDLPTEKDSKNPPLDFKVKGSFKRSDAWRFGRLYYNEAVEVGDDHYDSLEKYGINNKKDIKIEYRFSSQELDYKDDTVRADLSTVHDVPLTFDRRYIEKAINRLSFYHFENLRKYVPLIKSREEFLGEKWLNLYGRTIYVTIPSSMTESDVTPTEKLNVLEEYLKEVAKKIRNGYSKKRGTGKFIGYPIKDYVQNYRKRVPNYDTASPQKIDKVVIKDDYFAYDSALLNQTEKQLVGKVEDRLTELKEEYSEVFLIRMDENMHRESAKSGDLKLFQFGSGHDEIRLEGFQPDFILYLENAEFIVQIFIEPKGMNIEQEQWKEDLLMYITENEAEIFFEDETEDVKIKGVKFYTMDDGRGTINQIGELALKKGFDGLSFEW